jgi:predicted dehydrogenase
MAHVPGWRRDPRCTLETICDVDVEKANDLAAKHGVPDATDDWEAVVADPAIDVVDVATPSDTHFELATAALERGKHVLCEKPVAHDYRDTRRAAALARENGLKTKLGFTFRYSPGVQYAKHLIDEGFVGRPFFFNGYEQNSQWLDPRNPLRQEDPDADQSNIRTASIEAYGAPVIDIGHWWVGSEYDRVVGTMRNFVEERVHRDREEEGPIRMNIDDGDVFIGEYENGALGTIQTSFVTVGSYPGIEARIYGERGAIVCRLVQEGGVPERIWTAAPDPEAVDKAADVEFVEREIPAEFYPAGGHAEEDWRSLFYANLIRDFLDELTGAADRNRGNFEDGARVQESINAMERAAREDRWVDLPPDGGD